MLNRELTYICFMNQSGYSQAAQNYIFAINETKNFDIKVKVIGDRYHRPAMSNQRYENLVKMSKREETKDSIYLYHCIPNIQRRYKKYKKSIGFATFETFSPPESWAQILNQNDAIIVPSEFNYKIFSHMDIKKPIYYIPHCLDFNIYNKDVIPLKKYDKYTFLFLGVWKERKGYEQLLEAWIKEFTIQNNTQLVIKTDKPKKAEQYFNGIKHKFGINKGIAPVFFEDKVFDEIDLPRYIKSFDCLVSPTMGEGFGMPGLQCMALGIPVIITNYSGNKDYANTETATLIEPTGFILKKDMDGIPQFRNKKWAFLEVKKIQYAMRSVLNNKDNAKLKSHYAYSYVKERFSYDRAGKDFSRMMEELYV